MKDYVKILEEAKAAGKKAFDACVPVPVSWVQADLFGKQIGKPSEPDPEGECGGAYITGIGGNSEFARWCKKNAPDMLRKGIYSGYFMYLSIDGYSGQSREKRKAYAEAFAAALVEHGVQCRVKDYLT